MFSRPEFDNLPAVDMHIHTVYCGHASADMTLENIVRRAEQIGLKQIAVTEHICNHQHMERLSILQNEFDRLDPAITVRLGAEVDVDHRYTDGRFVEQIPERFRPLIISTHGYPGSILLWCDDGRASKRTKRRLLKNWFRWATAAVNREGVDIFAHPGVMVSREGPEIRFEGELLDRFTDVFAAMRAHGVAFEINEHVKRKLLGPGQHETYHNLPALAVERGVKLSVGSDSHKLEQIGDFDWVSSIAEQASVEPNDFAIYDGPGLVSPPCR